MKPGLTCFWQVGGRSNIDFSGQVKLDVQYIETAGFWVDVNSAPNRARGGGRKRGLLMKAILICPDERFGVHALAESAPLANVPILGKTLVEYLAGTPGGHGREGSPGSRGGSAGSGARRDRDGARWGLRVTVKPDKRERTVDEVRARRETGDSTAWLPAPNDVVLMESLPGLPQLPLFTSYADWFAAARAWMPYALTPDRIGVRERESGVWVGMNTHVAAGAQLIAPCWIGEGVWIEAGAVIGPHAVLEREVFVARGAEISHSVINAETFVGQFTAVHNSIASGGTLINWQLDSCLKVPDAFLLCPREPQRSRHEPARTSVLLLRPYRLRPGFGSMSPVC